MKPILELYYLLINHLDLLIMNKIASRKQKEDKDINIYIEFLIEDHIEHCKKVVCFCRKKDIFLSKNQIGLFHLHFKNSKIVELMHLIEEILRITVETNKESPNSQIFYCYLNFLIEYMGKNILAYKLLMAQVNERTKKNTKDSYTLEESAILDLLEGVNNLNLKEGNLTLLKYP